MKSITVKELKNRTGNVLRLVGRGEKVLVTKRSRPCALISPVGDEKSSTMGLRGYANAWKDIQKTLGSTKPRHKALGGRDSVVAASGFTVIDTAVFVIDLRYKRDKNFAVN